MWFVILDDKIASLKVYLFFICFFSILHYIIVCACVYLKKKWFKRSVYDAISKCFLVFIQERIFLFYRVLFYFEMLLFFYCENKKQMCNMWLLMQEQRTFFSFSHKCFNFQQRYGIENNNNNKQIERRKITRKSGK